jgi:protein-S-isoprenylcysteine O-methyltransferase Ste14
VRSWSTAWTGWALVAAQLLLLVVLASELPHARRAGALRRVAGVLAVGLGATFATLGARTLGRELRAHPAPTATATLRTDGAYALVRHPIYSGLMLAALGVAVAARTTRALAAAAALVALLNAKARFEERLLAECFTGYAEYARRTPRFVPQPRRSR